MAKPSKLDRDEARVTADGTLMLQGLVHQVLFKPNNSPYDPLSLAIVRHGEYTIALLSQEHVNALHEFLTPYVTEEN